MVEREKMKLTLVENSRDQDFSLTSDLYKVFSIYVYVCFIVYGVQCTYMYVYEEWLMCIQSMLVEWLAAIVN